MWPSAGQKSSVSCRYDHHVFQIIIISPHRQHTWTSHQSQNSLTSRLSTWTWCFIMFMWRNELLSKGGGILNINIRTKINQNIHCYLLKQQNEHFLDCFSKMLPVSYWKNLFTWKWWNESCCLSPRQQITWPEDFHDQTDVEVMLEGISRCASSCTWIRCRSGKRASWL